MVELEGLEKRWPELVVRADLYVETGRLVTLLGPSGCGKSTVLRLIAGLEKAEAGRIRIDKRDVTALPPRSRGVGIVFQDYALFPHLRVADNVAYGLAVRGMPKRERRKRAQALLDTLGLSGFSNRWTDSLSGGERQRVALARTLAVEPAVILFDEPLSSLDTALRRRLREELRDQQKRLGFTAILVTHDLEEAMAVSDRIAVMEKGLVLPSLAPIELWDRPPTASTARFLGHGAILEPRRQEAGGSVVDTVIGAFQPAFREEGALAKNPVLFIPEDAWELIGEGPANADAPLRAGEIAAFCLQAEFSGDRWFGRFEAGGQSLRIALPRESPPETGKTLRFRLKPGRARLIPRA